MAVDFAEPGIQAITLSLISAAAVLSLVSVMLGLFSTVTRKDPLPKRIRRLMRRIPASAEDFRLRGMSLMLNGAAVTLITSILAITVVERLTFGAIFGYASEASLAFPKDTIFLVTGVAAVVAVALFIAAYTLSMRVRYANTGTSNAAHPGMPPV